MGVWRGVLGCVFWGVFSPGLARAAGSHPLSPAQFGAEVPSAIAPSPQPILASAPVEDPREPRWVLTLSLGPALIAFPGTNLGAPLVPSASLAQAVSFRAGETLIQLGI